MKITIECPQCTFDIDITLHKEPEPILAHYHYGNLKECEICGLIVHVTVDGNRKEKNGN